MWSERLFFSSHSRKRQKGLKPLVAERWPTPFFVCVPTTLQLILNTCVFFLCSMNVLYFWRKKEKLHLNVPLTSIVRTSRRQQQQDLTLYIHTHTSGVLFSFSCYCMADVCVYTSDSREREQECAIVCLIVSGRRLDAVTAVTKPTQTQFSVIQDFFLFLCVQYLAHSGGGRGFDWQPRTTHFSMH